MAKKSLIIHDLDGMDLKYLPTIIDITTIDIGDPDEYDDNKIFTGARAFINSLSTFDYQPRNEDDIKAIASFIQTTETFLGELKKALESTQAP